jgi:hypothetical protein
VSCALASRGSHTRRSHAGVRSPEVVREPGDGAV